MKICIILGLQIQDFLLIQIYYIFFIEEEKSV